MGGRWKKEYQENVVEHRDIGGSARRGRGGGDYRGDSRGDSRGGAFMGHRREQREEICCRGAQEVWAKSPERKEEVDSDIHSEIENIEAEEPKSKEKKKKKKSKKEKKSKKKKKSKSSSSDSSEDEWIEKDVMESVAEGRRVLSD